VLPATYQLPGGAVLLLGGIVVCFFGYRFFKIALAILGFILGALIPSSIFGVSDTMPMLVAALAGGLAGAGLLIAAYFLGVALAGAGIGAVAANVAFSMAHRDPPVLAIVFCAIAGAVLSTYLQRYFVILFTAAAGSLIMVHGALAVAGRRIGIPDPEAVWIPYPFDPAPGRRWVTYAWAALGGIGMAVQLGWTGGERGRVGRKKAKS